MSSKRHQRRKSCEGKQRHPDREGALIAARKTARGERSGGGLGVYQCKHCHAWHVGHTQGSRFLITSHLAAAVLYHD